MKLLLVAPPSEEFVFSTWLRSYRNIARRPNDSASEWFDTWRGVVTHLFPQVRVAVKESAPNTIQAWICGRPGVLHYVYVPPELQRRGIGSWMVSETCGPSGVSTHWRPSSLRSLWTMFPYEQNALIRELTRPSAPSPTTAR